jgi:hypothetical protein
MAGAIALRPQDLMVKVSGYKPLPLPQLEKQWLKKSINYGDGLLYGNDSFKAEISSHNGQVDFKRKWIDKDGNSQLTYVVPPEVKTTRQTYNDSVAMEAAYNDYFTANPSLYWNNPVGGIDGFRAKKYEKKGFGVFDPNEGIQIGDKRQIAPNLEGAIAVGDRLFSGAIAGYAPAALTVAPLLNQNRGVVAPLFNIITPRNQQISIHDYMNLVQGG